MDEVVNRERPALEIGRDYEVEVYPTSETIEASYKGLKDGKHIFENDGFRLLVDDHWITEERRLITHLKISSSVISRIRKNESGDKK